MNNCFELQKVDVNTQARRGILRTVHGNIQTPFFMPVGTNGTVKTLTSENLQDLNSQIVLSNTYHLFIRPGMEVIRQAGGLHKFMNWGRPVLTDSGGYQVFSLSKLRKISEEGVEFQSHVDGKLHFFSPEDVVTIQRTLGSDIMMPLDECAPYPCTYDVALKALERTTLWAKRAREFFLKNPCSDYGHQQLQFGIIQGATFEDLRKRSAAEIINIGFDGYAVGGVSVGEPVDLMFKTLDWVGDVLPENSARYFMGIGLPDQIVRAVGMGIDMFDTCIPTRYGRNGSAFTNRGRLTIRNAQYTLDQKPIDESCNCFVCQKYTRSYIRHLLNASEVLGVHLLSYHNVYFYVNLMARIRKAVEENQFGTFSQEFLSAYTISKEI